jgi:hypothetical protein
MYKFSKNGKWQAYWGDTPLPQGSTALGTVTISAETGALIHLPTGTYVYGLSGTLQDLDQKEVKAALARSRAAGALGRVGGKVLTEKKLAACRANAKLNPGRPRKVKEVADGSQG